MGPPPSVVKHVNDVQFYFHEPHGRMIFTLALIVAVLVIAGWMSLVAQIEKCGN